MIEQARRPKAADITDAAMLGMIVKLSADGGVVYGVSRYDLARQGFPLLPEKVVLAKCRQLLRRGLISGCGCGCGGFFTLKAPEAT